MLECFSADKRIELVATSLLHDFSAVARPGGAEPASFKQRRLPAGLLRFRPHHTLYPVRPPFCPIAICNSREHKIYIRPVISRLQNLTTLNPFTRVLTSQPGRELR